KPLRSKMRLDQDSSILVSKKSESEGAFEASETEKEEDDSSEDFSQGSFGDIIMNEAGGKREEDFRDSVPNSYQSVFREILNEITTRNELEEGLDISLNKLLEGEKRKKLGILLKKNFERYKETILWALKKREGQKPTEITFTYHVSVWKQPLEPEPEKEKKKHSSASPAHFQKKLDLDAEWTQEKMKVHQGDGKLILYPSRNIFQICFPNGTGQIHYPSGNLAMLISCTEVSKVTYIVLEDSIKKKIRGLVNNSGHATFYDEGGAIWVNLSKILGYYFPKDKHQKAWNWWNLNLHVHAPPIKCLTLKLNKYIQIQIRSQDKVIFSFLPPKQRQVHLNLGTKFKFINSKVLKAMRKKTVLEIDPYPTSWKIQILLGKISQILNDLTISDLEDFTRTTELTLKYIRAKRSQI
ncbi:glutamate-rich protein 6B, partial [Nannospalax galili]|uniref:glutamate-rich protein 6B n=1 Tax=Nannospalax galili TaxID=1026970 RepID=UPI00111BE42E